MLILILDVETMMLNGVNTLHPQSFPDEINCTGAVTQSVVALPNRMLTVDMLPLKLSLGVVYFSPTYILYNAHSVYTKVDAIRDGASNVTFVLCVFCGGTADII